MTLALLTVLLPEEKTPRLLCFGSGTELDNQVFQSTRVVDLSRPGRCATEQARKAHPHNAHQGLPHPFQLALFETLFETFFQSALLTFFRGFPGPGLIEWGLLHNIVHVLDHPFEPGL